MSDAKPTNLSIRKDRPTAISSYVYGTGVDAIAFNLDFIALKNPRLAVDIIKFYSEASNITENDPQAPDEDLDLFTQALKDLRQDPDNS